jgi:hypothetical protein
VLPVISPAAPVVAVFSNFGPGSSYNIALGNPVGNAFDGNNYAQADSFVLSGDATFDALGLALSCFASCSDPFTVALADDSGNHPGGVLVSFTVPASALGPLGTNNPPLALNSATNLLLSGGTRYWVTVTANLHDSIDWNLNSTGDSRAEALSTDGGATWFSPSGNTPGALEIVGTIPEPASFGLLVTAGLLLMLLVRLGRPIHGRAS